MATPLIWPLALAFGIPLLIIGAMFSVNTTNSSEMSQYPLPVGGSKTRSRRHKRKQRKSAKRT